MTNEDKQIRTLIARARQEIAQTDTEFERAKAMLYHDEFKYSGEMARARVRRADLARRITALQAKLPEEPSKRGSGRVFYGSNT